MNGLDRYIFRQLALSMTVVTVTLTCVLWLVRSLQLVDMIVNRGLSAGMFIYLTMLLLPTMLTLVLPLALVIATLFVYTKMINDRELVVMRSAGLSQVQLIKGAMALASMVVVFSYALNLELVPRSYKQFRELQWDFRYDYSHLLLQEGAFNTIGSDITVYVRERSKAGELKGILVHDNRDRARPKSYMAERGALVDTPQGARVVMFNGNRQEVNNTTDKFSILFFERYTFDLEGHREEAAYRHRKHPERSLHELFHPEEDPTVSKNDYGKFLVEAHKRLASPFHAVSFSMVGLAWLISGSIHRRGRNRRVVGAAVSVIVLVIVALGLENLIAKRTVLLPLLYLSVVAPVALSLFFILRPPGRPKDDGDDPLPA